MDGILEYQTSMVYPQFFRSRFWQHGYSLQFGQEELTGSVADFENGDNIAAMKVGCL